MKGWPFQRILPLLFLFTPSPLQAKGSGFTGGVDIVTASPVWEGDPFGSIDYGFQLNAGYKYKENFYLMGDIQYLLGNDVFQVTGNIKSPWWGEALPVSPFVMIGTGVKATLYSNEDYLFQEDFFSLQPILNLGFGFDIFLGSGVFKIIAYQVIPTPEIQCLAGFDWTF